MTSTTTKLSTGEYTVYENVTIDSRVTISGNTVLNLSEGTTLTAPKGIELSKGNTLTINGPGALLIDGCDDDKSGIGAVEVGTLIINGGSIKVQSGKYAAAIGGDKNNISGGSITINGGIVNAMHSGLVYAPAIGGGYDDQEGHFGVCGDIVINGGQVQAASFAYGFGQGMQPTTNNVEDNTYTSGTLTLGWTNPDDYIYDCSLRGLAGHRSNVESVVFAEGKKFVLQQSKAVGTIGNIWGQTITPLLAPTDNGDNSQLISSCDGMKLPVMLDGRTLYKDGSWNTLCLPFNVTLNGSPLAGAIARPLSEASISGKTLNLTFGEAVSELVAGTPYIIKWAKANDYVDDDAHNIVSPVFSGVTIDKTDHSYDNGKSGETRVRFAGTYASRTFDATDKSILFMGGTNMLHYPTRGANIGAQRAYFKIGDDGSAGALARITAFSINFGDNEMTGIIETDASLSTPSVWYTIDGRKLQGKPAKKGVYISNGRKIIN
jgi:hypothetical protein